MAPARAFFKFNKNTYSAMDFLCTTKTIISQIFMKKKKKNLVTKFYKIKLKIPHPIMTVVFCCGYLDGQRYRNTPQTQNNLK